MNKMIDDLTAHTQWLLFLLPLVPVLIYFAIESRWEAYSRKKNYDELRLLNQLRKEGAITQEEFAEKKEQLLGL